MKSAVWEGLSGNEPADRNKEIIGPGSEPQQVLQQYPVQVNTATTDATETTLATIYEQELQEELERVMEENPFGL